MNWNPFRWLAKQRAERFAEALDPDPERIDIVISDGVVLNEGDVVNAFAVKFRSALRHEVRTNPHLAQRGTTLDFTYKVKLE